MIRGSHLEFNLGYIVVSHVVEKSDEKRRADLVSPMMFRHRKHKDSRFVLRYPCTHQKPDE